MSTKVRVSVTKRISSVSVGIRFCGYGIPELIFLLFGLNIFINITSTSNLFELHSLIVLCVI